MKLLKKKPKKIHKTDFQKSRLKFNIWGGFKNQSFYLKNNIFLNRVINMKVLFYFIIAVLSLTAIYILYLALKSKKIFKFLFLNAFFGIISVFLVYFTEKYTGVFLPINQYTVIGGSVLGLPSTVGFLILQMILM